MSNLLRVFCIAGVLCAASSSACPGQEPDRTSIDDRAALARRAGLRVVESSRLVLATDRPVRAGDGIEDLPAIFDQAVETWCEHYGVSGTAIPGWRAFGCIVGDRERFRAAGLLPASIPDFANGFCAADVFWLQDQSNPAYRRHLLLHEGVHAFTLTVRGIAAPVWYHEGIAEYLATHRLEAGPRGPAFVAASLPARASDVEQLGRIEELRDLRRSGRVPSLQQVLETPPGNHRALADYAASWAAVALLARHPAYAEAFAAVERGPLDGTFNQRLASMPGFDAERAARDFDAFTDDLDYGYDMTRSAIDWTAGGPLDGPTEVRVAAGRGWQNTRVALAKADRCDLRARGRCTLGRLGDVVIETEPDGISLDWYRGRPLGRLLAAQWVDVPAEGGRPRFVVLGAGADAALEAVTDGPLYLKINESPGDLADDAGEFAVEIIPARGSPRP
ncbi:MAG: hypothetical protein ACKO4T_05110 [Planctomycetaceae bacterium]